MIQIRISRPEDIPRQRELWQLAFGDDGAYVDNFYNAYYPVSYTHLTLPTTERV